jgi:nucleotide-binding universal stress UspA family protein
MTRQGRRLILVPLDGSRAASIALSAARTLSHLTGAVVHALHVSRRRLPSDQLAAALGMPPDFLSDAIVDQAVGEAEREIPRTAAALGAELIVMSTHGSTHDIAQLAGHVTLWVIQEALCPVLVIRSALGVAGAEKLRHVRRILVPLDGSPESTACVGHAADLARRNEAELCFLHVALAAGALPKGRATLSAPRYLDQPYLEMEAWREEFVARCLGFEQQARLDVPLQLFLRRGEPAAEIVRFASERACDLILAAWGGSLAGERATVVKSLLQRAPCPLLFLRAELSEWQSPPRESAGTKPRRVSLSPPRLPQA